MSKPTTDIFICSHLRAVTRLDDGRWFHVLGNGTLSSVNCVATIHKWTPTHDGRAMTRNPYEFQTDLHNQTRRGELG